MYIPEVDEYIPVAFIKSIPAFSLLLLQAIICWQTEYLETRNPGNFVSFTCPYLDLNRMKTCLVSDDEHFKMFRRLMPDGPAVSPTTGGLQR